PAHALDHPLAARIGILAGERHRRDVAHAELALLVQDGRRDVDAVLAAGLLDVVGRALVAEAARAEVSADPHMAVLVLEQVDIVVAGPDGAELRPRHLLEVTDPGVGPERAVEDGVVDRLRVGAAEPEAHRLGDVVGDDGNAFADVLVLEVDPRRHVAAADVEADARDRDVFLVGDDAADRLRIAEVAVGAEHAARNAADAHAAPHLRDGALVMLTEDLQVRHDRAPLRLYRI